MSVRKLSTTTWSFSNSGFGITFNITNQVSVVNFDMVESWDLDSSTSSNWPGKQGRHYWLYRKGIHYIIRIDGDKVIKHSERLKKSLDDLTKLLLKQMKASQQQYDKFTSETSVNETAKPTIVEVIKDS